MIPGMRRSPTRISAALDDQFLDLSMFRYWPIRDVQRLARNDGKVMIQRQSFGRDTPLLRHEQRYVLDVLAHVPHVPTANNCLFI